MEGTEWTLLDDLMHSGVEQILLEIHGQPARWLSLVDTLVANGNYTLWRLDDARYLAGNEPTRTASATTTIGTSATNAATELPGIVRVRRSKLALLVSACKLMTPKDA